jgi:hypothetical protein
MADVRTVPPVNQNTPRNYYNTNPLGSDFAAAQGLATTWGLQPALDPRIIQIIPDEFGAFKWYSQSAKSSNTGKEINWLMAQYPNRPAQVKTTTAGVAAGGSGVSVSQVIPVEDISIPGLAVGVKVIYADGTQGTISACVRTPGAATMTIASMYNVALSAVTAGDLMPLHSSVAADGTYGYDNAYTSDTQRYSNVIEMSYEMMRYDRAQYAQLKNQQMVDFIDQQRREMNFRFNANNEARLWLGNYGMGPMPPNNFFGNGTAYNASYSRGILQSMAADGVVTQNTTTATCVEDIKQAMFDASLLANTKKFLAFATSDKLEAMGVAERSERVRYTPGDSVVNTEVTAYKFFDGLQVTPIAVNAWKDVSYYGNIMRNELILIPDGGPDVGVSLRYQEGIPMMEHNTYDNINGGQAQYMEEVMRGQWGPQVKKAFTFSRFHFA